MDVNGIVYQIRRSNIVDEVADDMVKSVLDMDQRRMVAEEALAKKRKKSEPETVDNGEGDDQAG